VATHFSRLLRHAWFTVELFLLPGHNTGIHYHYRFQNSSPLVPTLSQMNPVHTFPPHFSMIRSNVTLPSTPRSSKCFSSQVFQPKFCKLFSSLPCVLLVSPIFLLCFIILIRGPFEKFVDSPYYTESELRGGEVTVSFPKYLLWQAIHFLQRSTHFSKSCCRPLINSKFLASEPPFHGMKGPEIA
jgi:hypothetical protein